MALDLDKFNEGLPKLMPYQEDKDKDFIIRLKNALNGYLKLAAYCGVETETLKDIKYIKGKLVEIVTNSLKGQQSSAFNKLQLLIHGKERYLPKINLIHTLITYGANKSFYRIRQLTSVYDIAPKELFHIPLNQRGIIKTQRYSTPGYPCLYLGESIYGCWEEMRRPPLHLCATSRFVNQHSLNLLDLTIPKKSVLHDKEYQKLIPLVISCMIPTVHDTDTYKPEYIIPQLIIELVLKKRKIQDKMIHGIAYTSTRLNKDFDFPIGKYINYAIPAFSVNPQNIYCKVLCELFKLTSPTTNDLEKLKGGYPIDSGHTNLDEEQQREENYTLSDFGNLEQRLQIEENFPLVQIGYKCTK